MNERMVRFIVSFLGALLFLVCMVAHHAAAARPEDRLHELKEKIRKEARVVEKIETHKSTLLGSLQSIDKKIALTSRNLQRSRNRSAELAGQIKSLRDELSTLDRRILAQKREVGGRLEVYYRLGKDGILPVLFSDATMPEKLRDMDALRAILDADWETIQTLDDLQRKKEDAEKSLVERVAEEARLQEEVREQRKKLVAKRREKDNLLFSLEQDEKLHRQLLEELRTSAANLESLLRKKVAEPAEADVDPMDGSAGSTSILARRGKLSWPVEGVLFRRFGNYYDPSLNARITNKGIDIRAKREQPVRAVWGGAVAYADWFRGYGKLIIIDHGQATYTVLSHLSDLTKREGEPVETGEIVGYAGDTGSLEGCLVHFEFWKKGTPQDPLRWIRKK